MLASWSDRADWKRDISGFYIHTAGKPWYRIPLPTGWRAWLFRLFHLCKTVSIGIYHREVVERCKCGSRRESGSTSLGWNPNKSVPLEYLRYTTWMGRNSRFHGTAHLVKPFIAPVPEGDNDEKP